MATTTCNRCNRELTNPASCEHGYGPVCWAKVQAEIARQEEETNDRYDLPFNAETMDIVCRRDGDRMGAVRGHCHFNIPQMIVKHSPSGMEWGYGGSGPSDFALNVLARFIGREVAEYNGLYHDFKRDFIAVLPSEGGTIKGDDIRAWIADHAQAIAAAMADTKPARNYRQEAWC